MIDSFVARRKIVLNEIVIVLVELRVLPALMNQKMEFIRGVRERMVK